MSRDDCRDAGKFPGVHPRREQRRDARELGVAKSDFTRTGSWDSLRANRTRYEKDRCPEMCLAHLTLPEKGEFQRVRLANAELHKRANALCGGGAAANQSAPVWCKHRLRADAAAGRFGREISDTRPDGDMGTSAYCPRGCS